KEVEVKREEKEETKEEKREKYKEKVPARIGKIVGETEDEDDDNEADEDKEDNDDDDEMIKEDVEELTKKSKDLDYACELWIKKVEGFRIWEWRWKRAEDGDSKEQFDPNEDDFDKNKREEFIPPRVPIFDTAPGQVVEGPWN
ncbi:29149_t:CDS:2, partial [Racocetra persica]